MGFYFLNDLIYDLWDIVKNESSNVITINYDKLVLKIYRKRKGEVSLTTIMKKLRLLEKAKVIKVTNKWRMEYGVIYSDKNDVIIYKNSLKQLLPERTLVLEPKQKITLLSYMGG